MPVNSYTAHPLAMRAFDRLFDSGNLPPPPAQFAGGYSELWNQYAGAKEFRGARCVDGDQVHHSS
jgi:hypothetical protein